MRVELQHPFDVEFCRAYVSRSKTDNRQRITLFREDKTGTVMSYARYLLSVKEGRILEQHEEADHINADPTDDSLENLQILTIEDHVRKTASENAAEVDLLICTHCGVEFLRPSRIARYSKPNNVFCGYSCNGKYHTKELPNLGKNKKITHEDILKMKEMVLEGKTSYRISKEIGKVGTSSTMRWIRIIEKEYGIVYNPRKVSDDTPSN